MSIVQLLMFDPLSKFCIWRLCSFIQVYVKNFSHGNAYKPRRTVGGMRLKNKGFVPPLMLHMFFLCSFRDDYCYTVIAGGENGPSEFEFRRKNVFCGTKRRDFRQVRQVLSPNISCPSLSFTIKPTVGLNSSCRTRKTTSRRTISSPHNPERRLVSFVSKAFLILGQLFQRHLLLSYAEKF